MVIDAAQITRLEELARLELSPEQRERTIRDLESILSYMAVLTAVDTAQVPPYGADTEDVAGSAVAANVFRDDAMQPSPGPDTVLANAPKAKEGQFQAPRSFE